MMATDGTSVGIGAIIVAVAGGAGAFAKSMWDGVREWRSLRRQSDADKETTRASILTIAQSQMNDLNASLLAQLERADTRIAKLEGQVATLMETNLKQAEEIGTLKDRVRELEP